MKLGEWQPIETAPKDGTAILVRGHDFGDRTLKKHTAIAMFENGNWQEVGVDGAQLRYLIEWKSLVASI